MSFPLYPDDNQFDDELNVFKRQRQPREETTYQDPVPSQVTEPEVYIARTRHVAYKNEEGERIINGINLDARIGGGFGQYDSTISVYFGSRDRAIEVFNENFIEPAAAETSTPFIPDYGDDTSGFEPNASESESEAAFNARRSNLSSDEYFNILSGGNNVSLQPNRNGTETGMPDDGGSTGTGMPDADGDDIELQSVNDNEGTADPEDETQTAAEFLGSVYKSVVSGWNDKLNANNVKLSSLVPFVDLYAVIPNDDFIFQSDTNAFSGIKNRLAPVQFISGRKTSDDNGNIIDAPPSLPAGLTPDCHVAKIGSVASQLQPDFYSEYIDIDGDPNTIDPADTGSSTKSYKGQPGISDLAVSRASSGAYNIKYDLSITLPNPEILNEQYEYSKLLLLNSPFLLVHGWNVKNSEFSVDRYPPNLTPPAFNTRTRVSEDGGLYLDNYQQVILGGGNKGHWSASIVNLMNFTFEFDNVGHLVGKLRFLTSQGAFMSAISTDMVSTKMLDLLKQIPTKVLQRGTGSDEEEKQKFIFANGVPWSRSDFPSSQNAISESAAELALRAAYRGLNDRDLFRGGDLSSEYFQGENSKYSFDRYQQIKVRIEFAVERAAKALQDIWYKWENKKGRGIIPNNGKDGDEIDDYAVSFIDDRYLSLRRRDGAGSGTDWDKIIFITNPNQRNRVITKDDFVNSIYIERPNVSQRYPSEDNGRPIEIGGLKYSGQRTGTRLVRGIKTIMEFPIGNKNGRDNFGDGDLRDASDQKDWNPFTYPDGNDLRNYFYNCILLDQVERNNRDEAEKGDGAEQFLLHVALPDGYIVDKDTGKLTYDTGGVPQSHENMLSFLRNMGRAQVIDDELSFSVPTFTGPPSPESIPAFGDSLQRLIFDRFASDRNLNKPNLSRTSVDADGNHKVLDQDIFKMLLRTSILSIPTLVTAPENAAPPGLPSGDTPQELLDETLIVINIVRRRVLQTGEGGVPLPSEAAFIRHIEIPNGYNVESGNIYSFANGAEDPEKETFEKRVDIPVGTQVNITGLGNNDFFISRKIVVLITGYTVTFDRDSPLQPFTPSTPRPIINNNNPDDPESAFIPEIDLVEGAPDSGEGSVPQEIKDAIKGLKASVVEHVRQSPILTQRDLGNTANIDVEIGDVRYDVIMRPTYFWLGSVLESLSLALNDRVKFFYKPVPIRTGEKGFTIPVPQRGTGDKLREMDLQIFEMNEAIVRLGGDPIPFKNKTREFYIERIGQTTEQENEAKIRFNNQILNWHLDFSGYMNKALKLDRIAVFESDFYRTRSDRAKANGDYIFRRLAFPNLQPNDPLLEGIVGGDDDQIRESDVGKIDQFLMSLSRNQFSKFYENFIKSLFIDEDDIDATKAIRDSYIAANTSGKNSYYFKCDPRAYGSTAFRRNDAQQLIENESYFFYRGIYVVNGRTESLIEANNPTDLKNILNRGPRAKAFIMDFINNDAQIAQRPNNPERGGRPVPSTNEFLKFPVAPKNDADAQKVENLRRSCEELVNQRSTLGFDSVFSTLEIKSTYEIPVEIGAVEQILVQEGGAPTHSMLKKLLSAASNAMPQLQLSMKPSSEDPSFIEIFVNAINVDGVLQEVFTEIEVNEISQADPTTPDEFRRGVQRMGSDSSYLKSNTVMVCNFGTMDSLVENFQMSSKIDANAFATFRLPSVMGGASMDIGKILSGVSLESTGLLTDIKNIIEKGPVGGQETLKELQIVTEDDAGNIIVSDTGLTNLTSILTNTSEPILRKSAQSFIEDLMSQDVRLYTKIMALQNQYFNGLEEQTTNNTNLQDGQRFAGSRFYGNILNTYLRTVTLTVHGTVGLNVFDYIYLKGLLTGVEGLYVINSVNESISPTSFTTTIECKLVEYTQNDPNKNPLAYKGVGNFERLAQINRGLRLDDGTIPAIDFQDIVEKIERIDEMMD